MNNRRIPLDGFHLCTGVVALVMGPVLLWQGERTGWCLLLVASGIVLLGMQWLTTRRVEFETFGRPQALTAIAGIVCVWIAAIYLSRPADDLPHLLPGHDGDSEHYRLLSGVVMVLVGAVLIARTVATARPRHAEP